MPGDRGVFPGQWALSGGGLEQDERIEEGLRREIAEELGPDLKIDTIKPWTFRDDIRTKTYPDGTTEEIYMIYLIFDCWGGEPAALPSTTNSRILHGFTPPILVNMI